MGWDPLKAWEEAVSSIAEGLGVDTEAGTDAVGRVADAGDRLQSDIIKRKDNQLMRQFQEQMQRQSSAAAEQIKQNAMREQRLRAKIGTGRRDTILTSPLGVPDEPKSLRRTLLGA